ncbi:MAG: MMPL family transporter [Polyangiaceae bacterium]|nr:MMPL family transporter [Polyangiaceae bacterium]
MHFLAHLLVRRTAAWATVFVVFLLSMASLYYASRVDRDDDVLAFLPRQNPEVGIFYDVSKRFGSLDVALVGVESDDVLAPDFLQRLRAATKRLNETDGIGHAMSLANVEDFAADTQRGGITTDYLIGKIPETDAERAALRAKVMSRDHVVGNLISKDGKAVLIYCFAGYGTEQKVVAQKVRTAIEEAFPQEKKYWGGAPFISTYIYDVTQEDMRRLAPWAVLVIVLITVISFRDVIGAGLALLSTAIGIVMSLGLMGALGVSVNVVLGSLPVILFALGSAYPVHILSRYYAIAHGTDGRTALVRTLIEVGPPVVASGLTTVVSLLSFLLMDIKPLRTFGIFTALGIFITLVLAMTFVPAIIYLARLKGKPPQERGPKRFHVWLCTLPQRKRALVGAAVAVVAIASAFYVGKLDSRMDNAAFFMKNSPPDQAERFLHDSFGGSLFLQIQIEGDMTDPAVLREVRTLADRIATTPHVTSVNHIGNVIAQINEAMEGDRRIPDTAAKVKLLYQFLAGKKAVEQLVTDDKRHALMHVKLDTRTAADTEPLVEQIRKLTRDTMLPRIVVVEGPGNRTDELDSRKQTQVVDRLRAVGAQYGVTMPAASDIESRMRGKKGLDVTDAVQAAVIKFLGSDECSVELEGPEPKQKVAKALAGIGAKPAEAKLTEAISTALEKPASDELVLDLAGTVERPLDEIWRRATTAAIAKELVQATKTTVPEGPEGERFMIAVATALMDIDVQRVALPPKAGEEGQALSVSVTGLPVMHAGLSQSVEANQWKSLGFSLGMVLIIMTALFRSLFSGFLGIFPIVLTTSIIYGGMGAMGVRLDIGTSMLASLIIGAGVDYAVHLMASWRAPNGGDISDAAKTAARETGPAIWVNALMVAAGFFVLTLGDARPLQNVGGLTSAAMITAALVTMLVIPLLARKLSYYGGANRIPAVALPSEASDTDLDTGANRPLNERGSR